MDRLGGAVILLLGPAVALWCATRVRGASAWRLLGAGAIGGVASGILILVAGLIMEHVHGSGLTANDLPKAVSVSILGGAGVGMIVGTVLVLLRAWWCAPVPPPAQR